MVEYSGNKVVKYLVRDNIGLIQTPQVFKSELIKKAHSSAIKNRNHYNDDASLYMNELGMDVTLIEGSDSNLKATTKNDLALLEDIL